MPKNFKQELENLLNKHNCEASSDTPDFILAAFLNRILVAFDIAIRDRERWYERKVPGDPIEVIVSNMFAPPLPEAECQQLDDLMAGGAKCTVEPKQLPSAKDYVKQLEQLVFSGYRFIKRRDSSGKDNYYVDTDDAGISCDTPQAAIKAAIAHLETTNADPGNPS